MASPTSKLSRRIILGVAAASATALLNTKPSTAQDRRHRSLLGSYAGSGCPATPKVSYQETWLGQPLDLALDFLEKNTWDRMLRMTEWVTWCWRQANRNIALGVPLVTNEPAATLAAGAAGAHDEHFRRLGEILVKKKQETAILRIGWEFNGGWYRWSARKDPAAFAAAWRRAALALRSVPGSHFKLDWNPAIVEGPTIAAYPGDDVVDIIGLDVYNQHWPKIEDPAQRWQRLLNHSSGLKWHRDFAQSKGKPRSFPEWATGVRPDGHGAGDDPHFINSMVEWMKTGGPVAYAAYWDYRAPDFDGKLSDGRMPLSAEALRSGLARLPRT